MKALAQRMATIVARDVKTLAPLPHWKHSRPVADSDPTSQLHELRQTWEPISSRSFEEMSLHHFLERGKALTTSNASVGVARAR